MWNQDPASGGKRSRPSGTAGFILLAGLTALVACVTTWKSAPPAGFHRVEPVIDAGRSLGAERCYDCHASYDDHHVATAYHADCESCHGPGELHAYTARPMDIRYPSNADCEACHGTGRRTLHGWSGSEHARSGVLCTDCHDTHNREPRHVRLATRLDRDLLRDASPTTQICSRCHPAVAARLALPSHHPVREGMLGCTDCHGPHESKQLTLGGRTALCAGCHQEVVGPWIYEHPPVSEDCGYCHVPHGASADKLLRVNQPGGCIDCHSLATTAAAHEPWAFTTRCTDCHSAVHGSHSDPHLRN